MQTAYIFCPVKIAVKREDIFGKKGLNIYKRKYGCWEWRYKNGVKPDGKTRYTSVCGSAYGDVKNIHLKKILEQKTKL